MRRFLGLLSWLFLLLGSWWSPPLWSQKMPDISVAPWQSRAMRADEGGLFFHMDIRSFLQAAKQSKSSGRSSVNKLSGELQMNVRLHHPILKKSFTLQHRVRAIDLRSDAKRQWDRSGRPHIYLVPAGKLYITEIKTISVNGYQRVWTSGGLQSRYAVLVRKGTLSNLGVWALKPKGSIGVALKRSMVKLERPLKPDLTSSLSGIIDGYSGVYQQRFGQNRLKDSLRKRPKRAKRELKRFSRFRREVAMYYQIKLPVHRSYVAVILDILKSYEEQLRQCYIDQLDQGLTQQGKVHFTIAISKRDGSMRRVKAGKGGLRDAQTISCLREQLLEMEFPVDKSLIGRLSFTFSYKIVK